MGGRLSGGPTGDADIALCHEWLGGRHGSEKTFEVMASAFPHADLHSLTWDRTTGFAFGGRPVTTTFLDRVVPLRGRRSLQLPLMPLAWRYASRRTYDVVVTSSHACAKGFRPARSALHLCYCYTPMRYLWLASLDRRHRGAAMGRLPARCLRLWDLASVGWVDEFAAISTAVQSRIGEFYGRRSTVMFPPVDTAHYTPAAIRTKGGFALAASRMVPYKRLDLAIRACHRAGVPLTVAGGGPGQGDLRALASKLRADASFVIEPDDVALRELYRTADVLVFPAEEDFGIVPVEAQACGTPVVAYGRGGVLDTVVPGVTGVLVEGQDEEQLAAGIEAALNSRFDDADCRRNAERFSKARFVGSFVDWVVTSAAARGIVVADPRTSGTI